MVPSGLEPPTSRLSGARSNLLSYEPPTGLDPCSHLFQLSRGVLTRSFTLAYLGFTNLVSLLAFGSFVCFLTSLSVLVRSRRSVFPFHLRDGDDGIRTHDPLLAGQVLSQLSYTPMSVTHRPLTLFFCFYNEHLNESRT